MRLVEFPGMDLCACCGTHVARTGEIGLLKLLSWARFHQGVRMEMVCGRRALDYLSQIYAQNRLVCQTFSASPWRPGLPAQRTVQALEAAKARAAALETRCFAATASSLAGAGDVVLFEEDLSPDGVRRLADAVGNACRAVAAIFSGSDEEGYRYAIYSPIGGLQPFVQALNKALRGQWRRKTQVCPGQSLSHPGRDRSLPPSRPVERLYDGRLLQGEASCFASKLDGIYGFFLLTVFILWVPSSGYQNIVWPKHPLFLWATALFVLGLVPGS